MSKLFVPVGIPGCGKSTLAQRILLHNNMRIIETDMIRADMVKEGKLTGVGDMSGNREVFQRFHDRIKDSLLDQFDVYADATNLHAKARRNLKQIADEVGAEAHLFVFTNLTAAIRGNRKRQRVVPPEAMGKMLEQFERALIDIPEEEYATVTYIESMS